MDAQDGVIYFLLDQMADQHVKEQMLAYFILLANSERPLLVLSPSSQRVLTIEWVEGVKLNEQNFQHPRAS